MVYEPARIESDLRTDLLAATGLRTDPGLVCGIRRRLSGPRKACSGPRWRRLLEGDETTAARFSCWIRIEQQCSRSFLRNWLFVSVRWIVLRVSSAISFSFEGQEVQVL